MRQGVAKHVVVLWGNGRGAGRRKLEVLEEGSSKQTIQWHTVQGTICDNGVFHADQALTYIFLLVLLVLPQ